MDIQRGPSKREISYSMDAANPGILRALLNAMETDNVPAHAMLAIKGERGGKVNVTAEWLEPSPYAVESESSSSDAEAS